MLGWLNTFWFKGTQNSEEENVLENLSGSEDYESSATSHFFIKKENVHVFQCQNKKKKKGTANGTNNIVDILKVQVFKNLWVLWIPLWLGKTCINLDEL